MWRHARLKGTECVHEGADHGVDTAKSGGMGWDAYGDGKRDSELYEFKLYLCHHYDQPFVQAQTHPSQQEGVDQMAGMARISVRLRGGRPFRVI